MGLSFDLLLAYSSANQTEFAGFSLTQYFLTVIQGYIPGVPKKVTDLISASAKNLAQTNLKYFTLLLDSWNRSK